MPTPTPPKPIWDKKPPAVKVNKTAQPGRAVIMKAEGGSIDGGAAFGVYPKARRAEANNDRRASADAPLSALRGYIAGTLGLPGDLEGLGRMLIPGVSSESTLPNSDYFRGVLPLKGLQETPTGRAFQELGGLAGGAGLGTALKLSGTGAKAVGRLAAEGVERGVQSGNPLFSAVAPAYVIKPKGGNWLSGSIEQAVKPLKRDISPTYRQDLETMGLPVDERELAGVGAMNTWLDQKLAKYIKNEMATPEDPIRLMMQERGISHLPAEDLGGGWVPEEVANFRRQAGFPEEGVAVQKHAEAGYPQGQAEDFARLAEGWEAAADSAIIPQRAGNYMVLRPESRLRAENPWLEKVPPETPTYTVDPVNSDLGFGHLTDELRNMLNEGSGLPRELLLTPEQLSRVTVPQAVERVAKVNDWRAAQKIEADAARANNTAVQTFKEYPESGLAWKQIKSPENPLEGWREVPDSGGTRFLAPNGEMFSKQQMQKLPLQDALKYEGDTMGHCVGGYCDDVASGRSQIFSLRDAKGEPHVTIEVAPGNKPNNLDGLNPADYDDFHQAEQYQQWLESKGVDPDVAYGRAESTVGPDADKYRNAPEFKQFKEWYNKQFNNSDAPLNIVQIKGKGNKAPAEKYLPMVQDFVKSGTWGEVGDLRNSGLRKFTDAFNANEIKRIRDAGIEPPTWATPDEIKAIGDQVWPGQYGQPPGFAQGGSVSGYSQNSDYNPALVGYLVHDLKEQLNA